MTDGRFLAHRYARHLPSRCSRSCISHIPHRSGNAGFAHGKRNGCPADGWVRLRGGRGSRVARRCNRDCRFDDVGLAAPSAAGDRRYPSRAIFHRLRAASGLRFGEPRCITGARRGRRVRSPDRRRDRRMARDRSWVPTNLAGSLHVLESSSLPRSRKREAGHCGSRPQRSRPPFFTPLTALPKSNAVRCGSIMRFAAFALEVRCCPFHYGAPGCLPACFCFPSARLPAPAWPTGAG